MMSADRYKLVRMTELLASSDDGRAVTALDEGSGPNLLVVHPGGGDATTWDGVIRHLTDDFRVVRIRRRIYVPGADIALPHSMTTEAADILAVADLLEPPVLLAGHSSGAVAALEAVLSAPSAFCGLFLYEPPLPTKELIAGTAGARARAALDGGDPVEAMRIHMRDIVRMPATVVDAVFADQHVRAALSASAAAQIADNEAIDALGVGMDRFAALETPTTLVEGDLSPSHLRERLADLAAVLPRARIVTLAGQGHIAHLAAPDVLADTIRDAAGRLGFCIRPPGGRRPSPGSCGGSGCGRRGSAGPGR
ncbi:alpha/beta hydrolase [Streptomyces sp. NPDC004549]|uniref:alpha/beta fold hydrolase n=1 Tax=Streptomyces sp. NPDC004549 TaxID=3154283 RepID=UPI0033BDB475